MPKAKDSAQCNICGKICAGVSACKAHVRAAHLKQATDADVTLIPFNQLQAPAQPAPNATPPPTQVPGFDMASFQQALTNAMAPVMDGLRGVQQTVAERPAPPPVASMGPPLPAAPPPPKTEEHKAEVSTAGLTEATGQKLCEGIECFRKSAEVLAEAVKDGTFFKFPQPQPPAAASTDQGATDTKPEGEEGQGEADRGHDGHDHVEGSDLHTADDAQAAMRKMLACPDGICQRAVRREVLANWPALFGPKLTIQMADEDGKSQDYFKAFAQAFATNDGTDVMPPQKAEGAKEGTKAEAGATADTTAQGEESTQDGKGKEAEGGKAEEDGQQGKQEEGSAGEGTSKELKNGDSAEPAARRAGSLFSGI